MSLSDPIADMLTRIRNASAIGRPQVKVKATKICQGIVDVLKEEGYILGYDRIEDPRQDVLRVFLKYTPEGSPVIQDLERASKPGRRMYRGAADLPRVLNGMGIAIVSTSKGVMSDRVCRRENVGGELLCTVS